MNGNTPSITPQPNLICFDLEGPLAPQDNAYELMRLFPQGEKIFQVISRYDDLLALEDRADYEPGDTLALIVPFLIYHGISERDVTRIAHKAKLVDGASELISGLSTRGWRIFCISTSYEQYALTITQRLGIERENVACTAFPLDSYRQTLSKDDFDAVEQAEKTILTMRPKTDDQRIKQYLDLFFRDEFSHPSLKAVIKEIKPIGGRRKVSALKEFAQRHNQSLSNFLAVGDSITDWRMLNAVNREGGISIAFNANEYALPYSTMSLASTKISDLKLVSDAWERGGRKAVEDVVKEKQKAGGEGNRNHFHWLAGSKDLDQVLKVHSRIRRLVREQAAALG